MQPNYTAKQNNFQCFSSNFIENIRYPATAAATDTFIYILHTGVFIFYQILTMTLAEMKLMVMYECFFGGSCLYCVRFLPVWSNYTCKQSECVNGCATLVDTQTHSHTHSYYEHVYKICNVIYANIVLCWMCMHCYVCLAFFARALLNFALVNFCSNIAFTLFFSVLLREQT